MLYKLAGWIRALWQQHRVGLVVLYFTWLLAPLVLASLFRPFGLWDYLTAADLFHFGRPVAWGTLASNALHQVLTGTFVVRPTATFLYDLQTLLFGGEFWLWYALKWAALAATVAMVVALLRPMGCEWEVRAAVAALLLFHPARFTLMLHAPDGWLALGICAQQLLLWRSEFRLSRMNGWEQLLWFAIALFSIGTKEVGYVFQCLLVAFVFVREPAGWIRLLPHAAMLAVWTWRLKGASGRAGGFVAGEWLPRLQEQSTMMLPTSTLHGLELLLVILAAYSLVLAWRRRRELVGQTIAFCWLAALAMLMFVTVPKLVAMRYAIPAVFLAAIPLGVALQALPRFRWIAIAALVGAYPLMTAGHIYKQELAYQDQFYQVSELLRRMETKARAGYGLAMSELPGDFGGETMASVESYLGDSGARWYGLEKPRSVHHVKQSGWPSQRFAVPSMIDPERMGRESGLDMRRVERVEALYSGDPGPLGRLTGWYLFFDRLVRRPELYWIDLGAAEPASKPRFFLYTVGDAGFVRQGDWTLEPVAVGRRPGAF